MYLHLEVCDSGVKGGGRGEREVGGGLAEEQDDKGLCSERTSDSVDKFADVSL